MTLTPTPESLPAVGAVEPPPPTPGRPIVLVPTPPGTWRMLLGGGLALLAPLFGFLVGSTIGPNTVVAGLSALQLALFLGVVVGGVGVLVAVVGGHRLYLHQHEASSADATPEQT